MKKFRGTVYGDPKTLPYPYEVNGVVVKSPPQRGPKSKERENRWSDIYGKICHGEGEVGKKYVLLIKSSYFGTISFAKNPWLAPHTQFVAVVVTGSLLCHGAIILREQINHYIKPSAFPIVFCQSDKLYKSFQTGDKIFIKLGKNNTAMISK